MTVFFIDANGRRSKDRAFITVSEVRAWLYDNSVFMSSWSVLKDDLTIVYHANPLY